MVSKYQEAKQKCLEALREFRCDVNDHLPDTAGGDDYYINWTLEDCEYIQRCINRAIGVILSTCMADHVSYEFHTIQNTYATALKEKDINKCRRVLNGVMEEFAMIHAACKAISKEETV